MYRSLFGIFHYSRLQVSTDVFQQQNCTKDSQIDDQISQCVFLLPCINTISTTVACDIQLTDWQTNDIHYKTLPIVNPILAIGS